MSWSREAVVVVFVAVASGPLWAADHPIGGDKLVLADPSDATRRKVRFTAAKDPNIDPTVAGDPTALGATLEITGSAPGDGATGPIALDASLWRGLGNPPGSRGYKFADPTRANGVKKVLFAAGGGGGTLAVTGGGSNWPYALTQPQGPITVRFSVGTDVYCAQFTSFRRNDADKVVARDAAPPATCSTPSTTLPPPTTTLPPTSTTTTSITTTTGPTGTVSTTTVTTTTGTSTTGVTTTSSTTSTTAAPGCGNGVVGGTEECDDGNNANGDGCSATCELESVNPAVCAGVPSVAGTSLDAVLFQSGFSSPVHVTAPRLDPRRVFVVEQAGRIKMVKDGTTTTFLDITGKVASGGERGLLSVAFHPDFETNGFFYVYYTLNAPSPQPDGDIIIARYHATSADVGDASSETILLTIPHTTFNNHNGGNLNFGPDGFLYAATGDGGSGGDPGENAQNDASQLGKLLRINPTTGAATNWAKGLRNPFRFSFDRATGDIYIGDVGQGRWEEIDYAAANPANVNYGWDDMEGRHCFEPMSGCLTAGRTLPVLEYCNSAFSDPACSTFQPEKGQAVTGGFVYRGCAMPDLHGRYFYSDFYTAFIRSFMGVSGGNAQNLQNHTADLDPPGALAINNVSSFGEDARGELYIADYDGEIYKIVPGS